MKTLPFARSLTVLSLALGLSSAAVAAGKPTLPASAPFGKTPDGVPVEIYTLHNANGCEAKISTYGGTVTSLIVPDRDGKMADVVLGFDSVEGYTSPAFLKNSPYFGALIGRYGNRIAKGKFTLEGKSYTLATNNETNHLHGGKRGFDKRVWDAKPMVTPAGEALELQYVSHDGEEGYPGTLTVKATYTFTDKNALELVYEATTDKPTVLNLTQHSYFNLHGAGNGDILDHQLMIDASKFTPIDATSIPEGPLRDVAGTPFDFRKPTAIGARIDADDEQLKRGKGYDHNFVLDGWKAGAAPRLIVRVTEPKSGRVLEVDSTEPGVQFYSGNFLDGTLTGKGGKVYAKRMGFCLEPQHYPDSPNRPDFPSVELKPGEVYRNTIVYRFAVEK